MKCVEGWFIETLNGVSYRLLINDGHYAGIVSTLRTYHGPWYLIKTTGLLGKEEEIVDSVNEENRVQIKTEWKGEDLLSFWIIDKNGNTIFSNKDLRVFQERVYIM